MGTHYSIAQRPARLLSWALEAISELKGHLNGRAPVFCYRGMSGIGLTTALALAYHQECGRAFGMIYVRKENEHSHGISVEYELGAIDDYYCPTVLVFVDDFVSSGNTLRKTLEPIARRIQDNSLYALREVDRKEYLIVSSREGVLRGCKLPV